MTTDPLPALPDYCWPVDTSCVSDWDDWEIRPSDGVEGVPRYSAEAKARAVALAGQTLRMLTLWRVGGCPVTVRPATSGCQERTYRTYPVSGAGSVPWQPVSIGGQWINIGCGHAGACGCLGAREVRLPSNAGGVTQVLVDGAVLDPSAYRLDSGGRLVRLDGDSWPLCQDLTKPDTDPGTWSVTYLPGIPVDGIGAYVAGVLAGEYVRACSGGSCSLPLAVTQIARTGVTITVGAFPDGRTGIRTVDAYLERWNPNGHTIPPAVWSPDVARARRV